MQFLVWFQSWIQLNAKSANTAVRTRHALNTRLLSMFSLAFIFRTTFHCAWIIFVTETENAMC
jgi:hypothetical protein